MRLVKDRKNTDYTDDCRLAFNTSRDVFGGNARISELLEILQKTFSITEWGIYDPKTVMNGEFEAFLLDKLYDFFNDKEVDFTEVKEKLLNSGDFLTSEKRLFEAGNIDERIWGIFLSFLPGDKRISELKND